MKKLISLNCLAVVLLAAALMERQTVAARRAKVQSDLELLGRAVESDHEETGEFPASIIALLQSSIPPGTFAFVHEPKDPWRRHYRYQVRDEVVLIECLGADGEPGGKGEDGDQSVRVQGPVDR